MPTDTPDEISRIGQTKGPKSGHNKLVQESLGLPMASGIASGADSTPLSQHVWEFARGPELQDPDPSLSALKSMDAKADSIWKGLQQSVKKLRGDAFDTEQLSLIKEFKNRVSKAALPRMTDEDKLNIKRTNGTTTIDYIRTVARNDPNKRERPVPASASKLEEANDTPGYVSDQMQTYMLAYQTHADPTAEINIGDRKIPMLDLELAWRAGAKIEGEAARKFHSSAKQGVDNLLGPNRQYTPDEWSAKKAQIASRLILGLSESEVDALYQRREESIKELEKLKAS